MKEVKSLCDICPHNKGQYKDCNDGSDCQEAANEIVPKLYKQLTEKGEEIEKYKRITSYVLENKLTQKEFDELFKKQALIAIAQLEEVKEQLEPKYFDNEQIEYLTKIINLQIKRLKGGAQC